MPTAQHDKYLVLKIDRHILTLPINPEEITYTDPARVNVQYTLDGGWVDHWGRSIGELTLKGTTGWKGGLRPDAPEIERQKRDGFLVYHAMLLAWAHYLGRKGHARFDVFIETDHRAFRVTPKHLQTVRTSQKPVLFQYTWSMHILQDLTRRPPGTDPGRGAIDPIWSAAYRVLRGLPGLPDPGPAYLRYTWPEGGTEAEFMTFVRAVAPGATNARDVARLNGVRTFERLPAGHILRVPVSPEGATRPFPARPLPPPEPGPPGGPGIEGFSRGRF